MMEAEKPPVGWPIYGELVWVKQTREGGHVELRRFADGRHVLYTQAGISYRLGCVELYPDEMAELAGVLTTPLAKIEDG